MLAHRFYYVFNPDSIALLRLAHYWWQGQWYLAISSYWGPLFSVLLSPLLGTGVEPFFAGRIAMGFSALIYLFGARSLLKSLGVVAIRLELCTLLVAIVAAMYSAMAPTADLLMSGLVSFGLAKLLSPKWVRIRKNQVVVGVLFGLAYLTKAIALPLTVLLVGANALLNFWPAGGRRKRVVLASAVTALVFVLTVAPWIGILSLKFGSFMFSSSGSLNHAIAGPPDVDRYHPVGRTFHVPRDNRQFAWEDPYGMPYKRWSPFEKKEYMRHQIWLIIGNAKNIFETFGLGLIALATTALIAIRPWRGRREVWWAWTLPLVGISSCLYLPVFADSTRYYLLSFPLLFGCALMLLCEFGKRLRLRSHQALLLAFAITSLFAFHYQARPTWIALEEIDANYGYALRQAIPMAHKLTNVHRPLEVASVKDDWRVGMFIAYATNSRWRGNVPNPTVEEVKRSGAQLIVVQNGHSIADELSVDPDMLEQSAPEPLLGQKTDSGRMRYFFYKRNSRSE